MIGAQIDCSRVLDIHDPHIVYAGTPLAHACPGRTYEDMPLWRRIELVAGDIGRVAREREPRETQRLHNLNHKLLDVWTRLQKSAKGKK